MKLNRYSLGVLALLTTASSFADPSESSTQAPSVTEASSQEPVVPFIVNNNDKYIDRYAYIQNPYVTLPSKGGIQHLNESQIADQNFMEKWFNGGTWNAMSSTTYSNSNHRSSWAYGTNIFAQTGQVGGFSFGGMMSIINPFVIGSSSIAQFMPTTQVVQPTEMFAEYQYENIVQADVGRINITNSPWISQAYYNNMVAPAYTYQGGIVNVNPGGGWLLTALGFNSAMGMGAITPSNLTMYNIGFDYGTQTANISNATTSGTLAAGASFYGLNNNYNLKIWGYNFRDYADMAYAENSIKLPINQDLNFAIAAQGGYENGENNSLFAQAGDGAINSRFVGLQGTMNYKWFGLNVGANSIWGPEDSYLGGAIVSPYTYQIATDPLYTTGFLMGMVAKAAGNAIKVTPSFTLLGGDLSIAPSYEYYATSAVPSSTEYDLVITYNVSEVKGLSFGLFNAYMTQEPYVAPFQNNSGVRSTGNLYFTQAMVNYQY